MIFNKIKYVVFAFLILSTGCKKLTTEPTEFDNYSVLAYITSDFAKQKVYVYRTVPLNSKDSSDYIYDKAEVSVTGNSTSEKFTYYDDNFYDKYYIDSTSNFKPGEKYYLNIKTETETITGETTLPGDFEINSHKNYQEITADKTIKLDMKWTKSNDSYAYILNLRFPITSPSPEASYYFINYSYITYDTTFYYNNSAFLTLLDTSQSIIVSVTAVDKNFYQHHFEQYNSTGINKGYGYFGSGTVKTVKLKIKTM